jgi:hypothetical protein
MFWIRQPRDAILVVEEDVWSAVLLDKNVIYVRMALA